MRNIVAIVGRPNVGKSTLFNRLVQRRDAIVDETSGVTRDRNYGIGDWNGKEFSVIDTGGFVVGDEDVFNGEIRRQVGLAIEEADVILFLVDAKDGVTPLDEDVAEMLRSANGSANSSAADSGGAGSGSGVKKVLLVVNKVDNHNRRNEAVEFYALGFPQYYAISAVSGSGTGDLLDEVVREMEVTQAAPEDDVPRLTVIGRPNVGKSSIINAFLGQERHIVTDVAGTTRDTIDTRYNLFGFDFYLVDTAGVRKKQKVSENIEFYSVMRSIRAIENSDICILMLDATAGLESQDINLFSLCERNKKGVVIVVNKWDLLEKENNTLKEYEERIKQRLQPFSDVPVVFTSVLKKQRIFKVLEAAKQVYENRRKRISTSKLNEILLPILKETPPPTNKGKQIKINYVTQLPTAFPSFVFFCNLPQYIKDPYKRFVENQLRKIFDFTGAPIILQFRSKN
ncbi:MAG: ribosome biogenesis GTPase Der [Bacteroidales bacterium]|jgi:GTP-binding protein|nr:ribosome biogenesis GTPase Der [Bacteroidales bacterium]